VTEQTPERDSSSDPRLRPIIARLSEIERKCRALGPRNDEAVEMASRLAAIIEELSDADTTSATSPRYAELARQLFPVARLFESLGFLSVAKELAHVDRQLTELDPSPPQRAAAATNSPPHRPRAENGERAARGTVDIEEAGAPKPGRRAVPAPVAIALVVLAAAAIISALVVVRQRADGPFGRSPDTPRAANTDADITPAPTPTPRSGPAAVVRGPSGPRSRLADLIGQARLAQQAGDLDSAISLLSQAASLDPKATPVLETAQALASELIARADIAADAAEWRSAADLLGRAREIAVRFELSTHPIDEASRRHGALERYRRVRPDDRAGLAALVGSHVVVLTERDPYEGLLQSLDGDSLRLQLGLEVADDGELIHTVDVPLAIVREVRVYENR
jgi:hypothetical protein